MNFKNDDVPVEDRIFGSRLNSEPLVHPEEIEKMMKERSVAKPIDDEVKLVQNKRKGKTRKRKGETTPSKLKKIISEDDILNQSLSSPMKRRLERMKADEELKLKKIQEENSCFLSLNILENKSAEMNTCKVIEDDTVSKFEKNICLNVVCLSKSLKIYCDKKESFSHIFQKVGDAFDLKASEFLLCHNDLNIQVDDTPESLNMDFIQEIECIPYASTENSKEESDKNMLKIKVQTSDRKEKVEIFVHKLEKIQNLMEKYAKLKGLLLKNLVFEFDGEKLTGTETPGELELEDGCCIDVKVTDEKSRSKQKKSEITVIDL